MLKIYLIAGEASGDNIGAKLMKAIKNQHSDIEFAGIGGDKMQAVGLESLFPMQELSLMGFLEVVPHIPKLWLRMRKTIADIKKFQPDVVITIDSPGFNFPIAKALKGKITGKLVHYIAPTVWAYKPKRAKKIAKIYDHLLVVLPFEAKYFLAEGLDTSFVGYPALEDLQIYAKEFFRYKFNIPKGNMLLCLAPGSREQEVKLLLPIFLDAVELLKQEISQDITVAIPCQNNLLPIIEEAKRESLDIILVSEEDKQSLFSSSDMALTKSGTITTEIAFYQVPMVAAYKMNKLTYWLIKRMVKISYATIINLLADKEIIPEMLQSKCNAKGLSKQLLTLMNLKERKQQLNDVSESILKLSVDEKSPSSVAAKKILEIVGCQT